MTPTAPALISGAAAALAVVLAARPAPAIRSPRPGGSAPAVDLRRVGVPVAVGCGCWLVVGGVGGAVVAVLAAAIVSRRRGSASGRSPVPAAELALLADLILSALEAGAAPAQALEAATAALPGPANEPLARAVDRLRVGEDAARVWRDLAREPGVAPLATAFGRAHETGAAVGVVLARLADDLERERRFEAEVRARSVGVRAAVPLGVCLLPSFLLLGVVPLAAGLLSAVTG